MRLKTKKAKISSYVIAAILFGAFITGSSIFLVDLGNDYSAANIESYNDTYDTINQMRDSINQTSDNIQSDDTDFSTDRGIWKLPWDAAKLFFNSMGTIINSIETFQEEYHVPMWFTGMVVTIILAILVFKVLAVLTGRDM